MAPNQNLKTYWEGNPATKQAYVTSDGMVHCTEAGAKAQMKHVGGDVVVVDRPTELTKKTKGNGISGS